VDVGLRLPLVGRGGVCWEIGGMFDMESAEDDLILGC